VAEGREGRAGRNLYRSRRTSTEEPRVKRNLTTKLALSGAAAALAFGAVACEVEEGTQDPGLDDPIIDDTGNDL
jgi:hypothetical protein